MSIHFVLPLSIKLNFICAAQCQATHDHSPGSVASLYLFHGSIDAAYIEEMRNTMAVDEPQSIH